MCDSHSPSQHRTQCGRASWRTTGLSGVNTDQHHWNQTISFLLHLGFVRWKGTPVWTSLLGAGAFLDDTSFEGSTCTLVVLHWNHLSDVECWNTDLLWDSTALVLMSAGGKFSTSVKNVQMFTSQIWLEINQKKQRGPWSWQVRKSHCLLPQSLMNVVCRGVMCG